MKEKIYLDSQFHCHRTDDGTMIAIETGFFIGKCDAFLEGHYIVPAGMTVTLEDGRTFTGQMIALWQPSEILDAYQQQYETMMAEAEAAYKEGVTEA